MLGEAAPTELRTVLISSMFVGVYAWRPEVEAAVFLC